MKSLRIVAAASITFGALAMTPTASLAMSDTSALVQKDVGCTAFFPGIVNAVLFTNETIDVSNNGGNTQLTCHFSIPLGFEPAKAMSAQGFNCGVLTKDGFAITSDSRFTATPGGRAHLSCQIKKP